MDIVSLLAQTTQYSDGGGGGFPAFLFALALMAISVVSFWKVFEKAGQPGWASIIPIYNIYILLKIAGRPGWWLLLYLIPVVNIVVQAIVAIDSAKAFGKSSTFGIVGLWLFSFIGYMILGFGDATYKGAPKH